MRLDTPVLDGVGGAAYYKVGGPDALRTFEHKGFRGALQWVDGEPALLIWSAREGWDSGVMGICLGAAYRYADPDGKPTAYCFRMAMGNLPMMGLAQLEIEKRALVDCIMLWLPDLLHMPPQPVDMRKAERGPALVDVTHEDQNGRRLGEASI